VQPASPTLILLTIKKGEKPINYSFGAAHSYIASVREYLTPLKLGILESHNTAFS